MGIEVQALKLLLLARSMGVDFSDTLTIGRQDILLDERQISSVFGRFSDPVTTPEAQAMTGAYDRFSGGIFERLGARKLDFMDISAYEGATVIHDLNAPLDPSLEQKFSLVFDGGTLEHVFGCTTALQSYLALPRLGGHLILALPTNNEMGHGFYQFSPEFFFRTLTAENGYRLRGLFSAPMFVDADWHLLRDPAEVGGRVGHNLSRRPTYLFAIAERIALVPTFTRTPQQSDYATEWQEGEKTRVGHRAPMAARVKRTLRSLLPDAPVELLLQLRQGLARPDPRCFSPFVPGQSPTPVQ